MGKKVQICALSLMGAFGYTTSAFAQAEAPKPAEAPAATTATAATTEPAAAPTVEPAAAPADAAQAAPAPTPAPAPAVEPAAPPPTAFDGLKIESKNGSATLKVGLLLQPQFEIAGSSNAALTGASKNLFLRRTRLLVGGTLFGGKMEYFFDTDSPNLFKSDTVAGAMGAPATTTKTSFAMGVQDAFATWKAYEDYLKVDAGYMLTPGAHNALQGAGTLYGLDYFANSFLHSNVFGAAANPVGRDAGAEVRGILVDGHIEYRLGAFQGLRRPPSATEVAARNGFRYAGRLQINILDPETAFFYGGTYLGKKKVLSVGAAYDFQSDYHHWAVDAFLDMPLGPGGLTAQVDFAKWNGGNFITTLPKETAIMAEAGYRFDAVPISPILRYEYKNVANPTATAVDEARYGAGAAFWPYGHNSNLKAFYNRIEPNPTGHGYNLFNLQWQLYFY